MIGENLQGGLSLAGPATSLGLTAQHSIAEVPTYIMVWPLSKIDQKEVRKNDKFYLNIDRFKNREKIEFEEIKSFIQEQIDANNEYSKNVQIVTKLFQFQY